MKCDHTHCSQDMVMPAITVNVGDTNAGGYWGNYCSYECASDELTQTFEHLMAGKSLDTLVIKAKVEQVNTLPPVLSEDHEAWTPQPNTAPLPSSPFAYKNEFITKNDYLTGLTNYIKAHFFNLNDVVLHEEVDTGQLKINGYPYDCNMYSYTAESSTTGAQFKFLVTLYKEDMAENSDSVTINAIIHFPDHDEYDIKIIPEKVLMSEPSTADGPIAVILSHLSQVTKILLLEQQPVAPASFNDSLSFAEPPFETGLATVESDPLPTFSDNVFIVNATLSDSELMDHVLSAEAEEDPTSF